MNTRDQAELAELLDALWTVVLRNQSRVMALELNLYGRETHALSAAEIAAVSAAQLVAIAQFDDAVNADFTGRLHRFRERVLYAPSTASGPRAATRRRSVVRGGFFARFLQWRRASRDATHSAGGSAAGAIR